MHIKRWSTVLLLVLISGGLTAKDMVCMKPTNIEISRVNSPIQFQNEPERKGDIAVNMRVNCKSGQLMVPSSSAEGLAWLDAALPIDFKAGLISSEDLVAGIHAFSLYGSSVSEDLDAFFRVKWGLGPESAVCKQLLHDDKTLSADSTCFFNFLDRLRNVYRRPGYVLPD